MDVLEQFGIEGKLLLVQFINFGILVFVVWKFILPRLTKLMRDRETKVRDSLQQAEQAQERLAATEAKFAEERNAARAESERIIREAREAAGEAKQEIMAEAKRDAMAMRERTEAALAQERAQLREELRAELAVLTIETTRKVLSDVVRPTDRKRMVKQAEKEILKAGRKRG
jgi:F-type H+-transporting ATPase subunit b